MIIQDAINVEQGSIEWKKAKLGHVSASSIADVMAKGKGITRHKYMVKLVAERLTGEVSESYSNDAMLHGVETEPLAKIAFENATQTLIEKTGFWKHPEIEWLGVSPDGLISTDAVIECKCPNTTTHIDYIFEDRCPVEYYKQIQCQLWVTGRAKAYFVSYDNRLPERNQLFIKEVARDEELIKEMETEVLLFLKETQSMIDRLRG
jgi:putative phage-type endonuclease